ncbi:unnamed protein product [Symbiodinium sp. KB8]|nr:unnamed protein product [Symbiodinium sp. KB8]
MEYQDVVAAYHKRAAQASAAKAHAATARTSPGRTPKRSFGDDATRTARRLDRMMAMGAGGGAAPAPVAEGDSPGASPAATSPAGAGGDAGHLSSGRVVNRRASEVRAAFPRAMGHQSAADAASPGSGRMSTPSFTSPPSKPDLGGGGRVTVRGLVSGTAPPQGKTPSPGAQRGTPGRQPPPTPDAGVDAPSLEPRPAGPAAEAAAAARAATSRALAEADAQAGESPSSSAPAAPGKAQASVEDIKGAAAAEAAALWEAGESKGPSSPLPSLNQLLAGQRQ